MRPLAAVGAANRDGFDVLASEDRAAAAASGMAAIVRDGRIANAALTR